MLVSESGRDVKIVLRMSEDEQLETDQRSDGDRTTAETIQMNE